MVYGVSTPGPAPLLPGGAPFGFDALIPQRQLLTPQAMQMAQQNQANARTTQLGVNQMLYADEMRRKQEAAQPLAHFAGQGTRKAYDYATSGPVTQGGINPAVQAHAFPGTELGPGAVSPMGTSLQEISYGTQPGVQRAKEGVELSRHLTSGLNQTAPGAGAAVTGAEGALGSYLSAVPAAGAAGPVGAAGSLVSPLVSAAGSIAGPAGAAYDVYKGLIQQPLERADTLKDLKREAGNNPQAREAYRSAKRGLTKDQYIKGESRGRQVGDAALKKWIDRLVPGHGLGNTIKKLFD